MVNKVTVQFTMTIEDRDIIQKHADRARMTVSQFCKMAVFARVNNYPLKDDKPNDTIKESKDK